MDVRNDIHIEQDVNFMRVYRITHDSFDQLLGRILRNSLTVTDLSFLFSSNIFAQIPQGNATHNLEALANALQHNTNINRLVINFQSIGAQPYDENTGKRLQKLIEQCQNLKELLLHENQLTPECIKYIAEGLKSNKNLKKLYVSANPFGDEGVEHLIEALKVNKSLKYLSLSNTKMTIESYKKLLNVIGNENKTLCWVDCDQNNALFDGIQVEGEQHETFKFHEMNRQLQERFDKSRLFENIKFFSSTLAQASRQIARDRENNADFIGRLPAELLVRIAAHTPIIESENDFNEAYSRASRTFGKPKI